MWLSKPDLTRIYANQVYFDFVGSDEGSALSIPWQTFTHPDDIEKTERALEEGKASGLLFSFEARVRRYDGAWRWLNLAYRPRLDADNRLLGFVAVAHDVTEAKETEIALREREAELYAFVNHTSAGFARVDMTGHFMTVNDRFCEIVGFSREALLQTDLQSITYPPDLERTVNLFGHAGSAGEGYTIEKRYVRGDGTIVWVNNSVGIMPGPDGKPGSAVSVTLDITERRNQEAQQRRSEETLRLATGSAGMTSWELDIGTMTGITERIEFGGKGKRRAHAASLAEWFERIHPDDRAPAKEVSDRCQRDGTPYTLEYRVSRPSDSREIWVQSHGARIDFDDGQPSRLVGITFDITARKMAEERLRDSEKRYRAIFEEANDYLFTLSIDEHILSVNPAVLTALGYSKREVIGRHVREFMEPDEYARGSQLMQELLQKRSVARFTTRLRSKHGRQLIWEINSRLLIDANGTSEGVIAIGRDMTEAERAQAHLRLLIDELNHRVKNSLAIVQGIAQQSFKDDISPADARRAFEGRLAALSEAHNLLTREQWGHVSMQKIIADATAPHGQARFELDGPDLLIIPKTAISLALAIHELATNAVKHGALSTGAGMVGIRWQRQESETGPRLWLEWREKGGPAVTPPSTRGFGTRMIERGLAAELSGKVNIEFHRSGIVCSVDAPLPEGTE